VIDNTITIDMGGKSYQTFTCSTANNISNIEVSGDILGSQGMVFVNAGSAITLNGITSTLGGSNVFVSYDDLSIGANSNAIIFFTSDGTNRYVNAGKYPGEITSGGGGVSNLQTITDNGNVTTNSITASYFIGDGSQLTNISKEYATFHPTGTQTTSATGAWTNIILNYTRKNSNTSVFSLNTSSGEITINKTGTYMVSLTVSTGISSSTSSRSTSRGGIAVNGTTDTQALVYMYNRMNGAEHNTGAMTIIRDFTSGDKILLRFLRQVGSDTISSIPQACGLTFLEL